MAQLARKLGHRVAERRRLAGLTQAELADRVGVAMETISRMERGSALPGLSRIEAIARALNTDLTDLFDIGERSALDASIDELAALLRTRSEAEVHLVRRLAEAVFERVDK